MGATTTGRLANAADIADTSAATSVALRPDLLPTEQAMGSVHEVTGVIGMSDVMRTVIWITGVAFGVVAPGVFAQGTPVPGAMQKNPVFAKLDANHDGFVSREEAKQSTAVSAVFSQADTDKDGKLDEDELIKALSISQRDAAARLAGEGGAAASQYAADSEITAKVKSALLREEGLRSLDVAVQTYKGKVQLAGFVASEAQIAEAERIAARVSGVTSVLNNLAAK